MLVFRGCFDSQTKKTQVLKQVMSKGSDILYCSQSHKSTTKSIRTQIIKMETEI